MASQAKDFKDYYEVLGCEPDASQDEIKKAYHKKLREFHPDKRQTVHGLGHKVSQLCNEAWEVLSSAEKRDAYDKLWCRHFGKRFGKDKAAVPQARKAEAPEDASHAERCRHEGNELYKAAAEALRSDVAAESAAALEKFRAALAAYSSGIDTAPHDHRLLSNRSLCHAALHDWSSCYADASRVTRLNPKFAKGWFMLAKAIWKQGHAVRALEELENGLQAVPDSEDLARLQAEIKKDAEAASDRPPRVPAGRRYPSRNPSPSRSRPPSPPGGRRSKSPVPPPPFYNFYGSPRPPQQEEQSEEAAKRPPIPRSRRPSRSPMHQAPGAEDEGRSPEPVRVPQGMPAPDFDVAESGEASRAPRRGLGSLAAAAAAGSRSREASRGRAASSERAA